MAGARLQIFVSSVQKGLADDRRAVKAFVEQDPLLRRFFTVFLFEDLPAGDRRADAVYLAEVDRSAVYLGLFGNEYGFEDTEGLSPTEREFDRATDQGKHRLIFVKGLEDGQRHPRMKALVQKAGSQLIRRRYSNIDELKAALYASLVDYLETCGVIQYRPFEERAILEATSDDLDNQAVANFVRLARSERQFPLPATAPMGAVLTHLHLLCEGQPTNAALLLFGLDPQRFLPSAEVRCMHFHGTEIQRPPPLTPESLRQPHGSVARNPRLCEALFLARYIEKYGTGTLLMIRESLAHNLPEPDFVQRGGEFTVTLWRDWLTATVMDRLGLSDRQKQAVAIIKSQGRITNRIYRDMASITIRSASRDLEDLVDKGVLSKVGTTGRNTFYIIARKLDVK